MTAETTQAPRTEKNGKWFPVFPVWTAADLMTPNPVSLRSDVTVAEATAFFDRRGIAAAPVIDDAGRPIGVLSRTDIIHHVRGAGERSRTVEYYQEAELVLPAAAAATPSAGPVDRTPVTELMTPLVYSVPLKATVGEVIDALLGCKVHRLFAVDGAGVISAMDILRKLRG